MYTADRALIGVGVFMVLLGIYAWFDHNRQLDCRTAAHTTGVPVLDAVKLCKR